VWIASYQDDQTIVLLSNLTSISSQPVSQDLVLSNKDKTYKKFPGTADPDH
jgi:hypothetical protein